MTTLATGSTGIRLVTDYGAATYPAWQPGSRISISKTVDALVTTMLAGLSPSEATATQNNCTQVGSFVRNNVQHIYAANSGVGWGTEVYMSNSTAETSRHDYNAVESGKLGDTPPLDARTNSIAQGLTSAAGDGMIRIVKPCFYIEPGEELTPGFKALNTRELYGGTFQITYTWGLAGNDHIISCELQITIPTDATIQSKTQLSVVPFYHYQPDFNVAGYTAKPFNTQEWIDLITGAASAYTPGEIKTDKVLMCRSADSNFAVATVYGPGALADAGSLGQGYKGLQSAGLYTNSYGFCIKTYPSGIPAGTVTIPFAICFGSAAQVATAVVTANSNLAAASYPT